MFTKIRYKLAEWLYELACRVEGDVNDFPSSKAEPLPKDHILVKELDEAFAEAKIKKGYGK